MQTRLKKLHHTLKKITKDDARKALAELTILPTDLAEIQPRSSQVWNCGEIGIDPNGK